MWGWLAQHVSDMASASVEYLLESSRVFPCWLRDEIPWFPLMNMSSLVVFWLNPANSTLTQELQGNKYSKESRKPEEQYEQDVYLN